VEYRPNTNTNNIMKKTGHAKGRSHMRERGKKDEEGEYG
jgi:hypothetical protein